MDDIPAPGPVLHPTDFSEGSGVAYPYALYLSGLFGAELRAVHVCAPDAPEPEASRFPGSARRDPGGADGWPRDEASRLAAAWLAEAAAAGATGTPTDGGARGAGRERPPRPPAVRADVVRGDEPATTLLGYAQERGAGAVVMGTHGRQGLRRLFLGSVAERVIRGSAVPVLTVRREIDGWSESGLRRVLVAADLSPALDRALRWAAVVAAAAGAELEALHVIETPVGAAPSGKRRRIHAAYRELDAPAVRFNVEVVAGDPADRIRQAAREDDADLVVTATHGRSGASRLVLGSVAEQVVRRAPCPVLTLPPERG